MEKSLKVRRGDIFLSVNFTGSGSEQQGLRPCVVVSNDKCNMFSNVVTVVPLTAKVAKADIPTHYEMDYQYYRLRDRSIALGEQVTSIDKARLGKRHRIKLSEEDMKNIDNILRIQLNLL